MTLLSLPLHRQPDHGPALRLFDITLRANQARFRLPPRRRWPKTGPKARPLHTPEWASRPWFLRAGWPHEGA
jgi:hypothetical protein